jgi:DNA-binding NtrC family response regulator
MNVKTQILIVDDDAVVGQSFDRVLTQQGYEITTVLSGEEALNKIDDNSYDLVFTDIRMPGMDGLEVAERIMDRCPWTPVVVITGYGTEENEKKAKVLGTSGFVRKPLTPEIIENITLKTLQEKGKDKAKESAEQVSTEAEVTAEPEKRGFLRGAGTLLKNIGLFFAAPFIGLAYVIAMPFVFFGMLVKLGFQALVNRKTSG